MAKKINHRWQQVARFVVYIDMASTAKMFRIRTAVGKSDPMPTSSDEGISCPIGKGEKFAGIVRMWRKEQ